MRRPLVFAALLYISLILMLSALDVPLTRAVREGTPLSEGEERYGTLSGTLKRVSRSSSGSLLLEIGEAEFSDTEQAKADGGSKEAALPGNRSSDPADEREGGWYAGTVLVYADEAFSAALGSRLLIRGSLSLFPAPDDPGEFDQKAYRKAENILLRMTAAEIVSVCAGKSWPFRNAAAKGKSYLESGIAAVFGEEDAGTLRALLLGDKSRLQEKVADLYEAAGIRYVLTVSGLHVSLAAGVFDRISGWLLSFIPWQRLPGGAGKRGYLISRAAAAGLAVCFYTEMAGCGLPLRRAAVMYLLFLLARAGRRDYDLLSALSFALLAAVIPCPYVVFQASFQLSFVCVLVIGWIFPALCRALKAETPLLKALLLPPLLQLLTTPLQLWHYYVFHPAGFLANLLILPLMTWIVLFGAAAAVLAHFFLPAGIIAAGPAHFALAVIRGAAEGIRSLPFSTIITGRPGLLQVVLYVFLCLLLLLFMIRFRRKRTETALTALMNAGISPVRRLLRESRLTVLVLMLACLSLPFVFLLKTGGKAPTLTSLYTGQGECHVIEADGEAYLIDGGSSYASPARTKILPYLKYAGIRRISFMMVSHCDEDHMNALAEVMAADGMKVDELVLPVPDRGSGKAKELEEEAARKGIPVRGVTEGERLTKGSADFLILSPDLSLPEEENDSSLVMLFSCGSFRGLFTGDIGSGTERRILQRYGELIRDLDFLKVAHHGSRNSSCEDFLQTVSPTAAVISCGRNNRYGHPHEETLTRLSSAGSLVLRTDENGAVRISKKDDLLKIQCYKTANSNFRENFPQNTPEEERDSASGIIR